VKNQGPTNNKKYLEKKGKFFTKINFFYRKKRKRNFGMRMEGQ
jgi:hypothetical protein